MNTNSTSGQSAHTAGPWFVGAQNDALYIIDRRPAHDNDYPNHDADADCIAKVYDDVRVNENAGRANAELIASAPDLLEALRDLVDTDWAFMGADADPGNPQSLYSRVRRGRITLAKVNAAIARATGEQA